MKQKKKETVIVIGERVSPVIAMTKVDREKGRYKEKGKDHYYL